MLRKLFRRVRPRKRNGTNGTANAPPNGMGKAGGKAERMTCEITLRDGVIETRYYTTPDEFAAIVDEQRRERAASSQDRIVAQKRMTAAIVAATETMED